VQRPQRLPPGHAPQRTALQQPGPAGNDFDNGEPSGVAAAAGNDEREEPAAVAASPEDETGVRSEAMQSPGAAVLLVE
jgi:hypothetical protein